MKAFVIFIVYLTLAFASFGYARHHYIEKHSPTSALVDSSLFGDWVKQEWVFAIVVPGIMIVAAFVSSSRK
jgi:hypothetical protein